MGGFFFIDGELEYETDTLLGKHYAGEPAAASSAIDSTITRVEDLDPWSHGSLEAALRALSEELGVKAGDLFGVIRVAVTGKTAAPPLFETLEVLGRRRTLERLRTASKRLAARR
jgi:glutamyl-tRNA synthetase